MPTNDYHFITHWHVESTVEEVADVLGNGLDLTRWWPSVYLAETEVRPPREPSGVGRVVALETKGWLPYTLRWQFEVTGVDYPRTINLDAHGDFEGRGMWTFTQAGPLVDIMYDWRIRADKPLLRYLSFAMKPFFAANHRWAMAQGEKSLVLELARRHAATAAERAAIPAPPGPTTAAGPLLGGAVVLAGLGLVYRRVRTGPRTNPGRSGHRSDRHR